MPTVDGSLSIGTLGENFVYLDEGLTMVAWAFAFNSRFVGQGEFVPAIFTGTMSVLDESGSIVVGYIFFQGIQNADSSVDLAITGGSGIYVGISKQVPGKWLSPT